MAMLKSSVVQGSLRVTDTTYTNDLVVSDTTAPTIANNDYLLVADASDGNKLLKGPVFDGSTTSQALTKKGTWASFTNNAGTVTSVQVQATSPVTSSTSTAQTGSLNTTIALANAYGDTKNPYGNKNINTVLAGPSSGSAAAPSFRTLVAADIPSLAASKINSGTFDAARIPNLSATKITSDTLGVDRIPNLAASKINSGTFDAARIPVLNLPLVATYNLAENTWKQFIVQTDNKIPFSGTVRIRVYNASNTAISQQIDVHFLSRNNTIIIYGADSTRTTWSGNSGVYQLRAYTTKEDGNNSTYASYKGGVDLWINSTTTRTIEIYGLELKNCTINSALVATTYNSTYHNIATQSTCSNRYWGLGLQGGADSATWGYGSSEPNGYRTNGSTLPLTGYGLFGVDKNGLAQGISIKQSGQTANTVDISTSRVYNTAGIDWTKGIFYTNSGTWFAVNAAMNITASTRYYSVDLRYSDNCINNSSTSTTLGMVQRKPVYLRGYIYSDNLFYLLPVSVTYNSATYKRAWTQDIPTTEETTTVSSVAYPVVYIYLGFPYYDNAHSNYRLSLAEYNPVYWYKDGSFRLYNNATKALIGLSNVENTALSTWAGTNKITTVGTISTGTWQGTKIGASYLPTASTTAAGIIQIGTGAGNAAAGNHGHGNIQNGGTLQSSDITIGSGDKLVVTDSSDSSKIARASLSFDGSTTTQVLTKKGTWEGIKSVVVVNITATTSTSIIQANSLITANHIALNDVVADAQADITVTTENGQVTVRCSAGIPTFKLILALPQ